ncbi:MAG: IPT/TIG domain-containing protein [Puniceicoccaceae bacterium]
MKIKAIRNSLFLMALLVLLGGCNTVFQDFTPERIPENPSGIYTFSFSAEIPKGNRIKGSERADITINNETFPMVRSATDDLTFSYDYKMPAGIKEARYYYTIYWDYSTAQGTKTAVRYSTQEEEKVFHARLINRYPIQLVNDRGPAGSRIPIVGSGFSSQDVVVVGGVEAATTIHSPNSIEFTVPALSAGRAYRVVVRTGGGDLPAGNFRIDEAAMSVQPDYIELTSGATDFVIIETGNPAPLGGLYVEAQTDIPDSIIMPEIIIPEGARSVNVNITGGEPGNGVLVLTVPGFAPVEIPVSVY